MNQRTLLEAIYDDDRAVVKKFLSENPAAATVSIGKAKLYQGKIVHWVYVGDMPLHLAAAGYRLEIVQLLLAAGADPNSAGNRRQSGPLHYAADSCVGHVGWDPKRQVETIQCLLKAGARINAPDKNGATPLHRAVRTRGAAAVHRLLKEGADPLLRNKPGSAPFHLAVQNTGRGGSGAEEAKTAQREIIKEFLSVGVSIREKDGEGKSVLDCARSDWIRNLLCA